MTSDRIRSPYLLLTGDTVEAGYAKTAAGLLQWAPKRCAAQWRFDGGTVDLGLPFMTPAEATGSGIRTVVIGVAPPGGGLPPHWVEALQEAIGHGLDIAAGLHIRLAAVPALRSAAQEHGVTLHDVRVPPPDLPLGTGARRSGRRLLTVGTDCAVGKKYTALAIAAALQGLGVDAGFPSTGQTGSLIPGTGIPSDAVVSDFLAGAAETLSPDNDAAHWDIIEGQGSLFHPAYAGVSLGLLHGSQPDAIVLCHELGRKSIAGVSGYAVPDLAEAVDMNLRLGRLTNPGIRCVGISINSSCLGGAAREAALQDIEAHLGVPCVDPLVDGVERILQALPV